MEFKFGAFRVEIDTEKTRRFYSAIDGNGCTCSACVNFELAAPLLPQGVTSFFASLGIDIKIPVNAI